MAPQTKVQEHRQQLMQLRSLADQDLRLLLSATESLSVAQVRDLLIRVLPELVSPYVEASGLLAATLFEDLRDEASRRGTFYAQVADAVPSSGWVEGTARWAVDPLAKEALTSTVLTRVSGAVSRIIMDGSRDTIYLNGEREGIRFQRMARPGACAFCGMLASRPPWMLYKSEASAGGVVGRGKDIVTNFDATGKQIRFGNRMARGVKRRGSREIGASTHDECRCVVMPIYPGTHMALLAQLEQEAWEVKYQQAQPRSRAAGMTLAEMDAAIRRGESVIDATDTKKILAEWRQVHGTR